MDRTAAGQPSAAMASQPQVSGDGRYVAFSSPATDLVAGTPAVGQIYVWDRTVPYLDGDGSTIAFTSTVLNLTAGQPATRTERAFVWQR